MGSSVSDHGTRDPFSVRLFAEGVPTSETPQQAAIRRSTGGENDGPSRQLGRYIKEYGENKSTKMEVRLIWRRDRFLRGGPCYTTVPAINVVAEKHYAWALAIAAEQLASSSQGNAQVKKQKRIEADALRARLRDGDFRGGDRIVLSVRGDSALTDTFTVHPGRTLRLPNLPELPLQGVLRAELRARN